MFKILIAFSLGEREVNVSKGGVDDGRRDHGDKSSKSMKVKGGESMSREFC